MTETPDTPEVLTGVAPVKPTVAEAMAAANTPTVAVPKRTIGSDSEAALRDRHLAAQGEHMTYTFRGEEYKLLTPMPAAFMVHSGQIQSQNSEDVDMREFVSAIRSAFVGKDGDAFIAAMLDTDVAIPADAEYISNVLTDIVKAVTSRPSTS